MLLTVESKNSNQYGTILHIYEVGGKHRIIRPPIQPYFYSLKPLGDCKPVVKRFLSDLQEHQLYQVFFRDTEELERSRGAGTFEDNVPFTHRIAIDVGYKCDSQLPKVVAWDVESITEGASPDWQSDMIKSIAVWGADNEERCCFKGRATAIQQYLDAIRKNNPDIICDFFGRFYDMLLINKECDQLAIKHQLGRNYTRPYVIKKEFERRGKGRQENTIRIDGRIHFDVHKEVQDDYALTRAGIKDRTLNTTAQFFGLNPITDVDHANIPDDRLEQVNLDDARCTYETAQIYLRVFYELAEYLSVPLQMIVERQPSHIPNLVYGRGYKERGIVSDGENQVRFANLFPKSGKAHEGAFNEVYKTGVLFNVDHYDYSSFYVCVMIAFNLDPETVQLLEVKPYTGEWRFEDHKDHAIVEVPDKVEDAKGKVVFARQVVCHIDLSLDSIGRIKLREILQLRKEAETQYKKTKGLKYRSQSLAYKLVGNLMWGYHSMRYSRWGSLPVGILIAALARYIIQKTVEKRQPYVIQTSTDGWYELANQEAETLDLKTILPECFDLSVFKIGKESYEGMISLDKKDYVLLDKGKVKKYGSALLGRHQPLIVDKFIDDLCLTLFNKEEPTKTMQKYNDLSTYLLKDFVVSTTISKQPSTYNTTTMYYSLLQELKKKGIQIRWGDSLKYVKTVDAYVPTVCMTPKERIDFSYYKERLATVVARFLGGKTRDWLPFFGSGGTVQTKLKGM